MKNESKKIVVKTPKTAAAKKSDQSEKSTAKKPAAEKPAIARATVNPKYTGKTAFGARKILLVRIGAYDAAANTLKIGVPVNKKTATPAHVFKTAESAESAYQNLWAKNPTLIAGDKMLDGKPIQSVLAAPAAVDGSRVYNTMAGSVLWVASMVGYGPDKLTA